MVHIADIGMPHPRLLGDPPLAKGPAKGITLDLEALTDDDYKALHWDPADGRPRKERLADLGLEEIIPVLYPRE